jgi:uncharacterized LabA/DUF88 family protein
VGQLAAYIDGFNLYYGMKSKYGRRDLWLDVVELIRQLRPQDDLVKVRYFSAIVKNEPVAAQNQYDYIQALKAHNGTLLDVHLGRFKERILRRCRRCGAAFLCQCGRQYRTYEEKGTDVALGAMMVADAALGAIDTTLLVSADTDLAPALEAVQLVVPSQRLFLVLPPGNTSPSRHLTGVANLSHFFIRGSALRNAQLPAVVQDSATGRTLQRSAKWR